MPFSCQQDGCHFTYERSFKFCPACGARQLQTTGQFVASAQSKQKKRATSARDLKSLTALFFGTLVAGLVVVVPITLAAHPEPDLTLVASDFSTDIDTNFIGTSEDYKATTTTFSVRLDGIESIDELSERCIRAIFEYKFPEIPNYDVEARSDKINLDTMETDVGSILKFNSGLSLLSFASLPDGTTVDFTLKFFQGEIDPGMPSGCAYWDEKFLSLASLNWIRPPREGPPEPPVLAVEHEYLNSSLPCSLISDNRAHLFSEFPISEKGTLTINGSTQDIHDPDITWGRLYSGLFRVTCNETSVDMFATISLVNDIGESMTSVLQFTTPEPAITREELDEQRKQKKIAGCESNLQISEFDTSSCGLLKVEVFQYDLNTGACTFLGYWRDSAGDKKVGMFDLCANNFGRVVEGKSYSFYVRNSGPVQYTNTLGTVQNVLYFTVLAQ